MTAVTKRAAAGRMTSPIGVLVLVLSGLTACSERIEPAAEPKGTPIVVVAAPESPRAPERPVPRPEQAPAVVETSLAASDLIYDSDGEVTTARRVADPYRTGDSIVADTRGLAPSIDDWGGTGSL